MPGWFERLTEAPGFEAAIARIRATLLRSLSARFPFESLAPTPFPLPVRHSTSPPSDEKQSLQITKQYAEF